MVAEVIISAGRGRTGWLRPSGRSVAAEGRRGPPVSHASVALLHISRALWQRHLQHTGGQISIYIFWADETYVDLKSQSMEGKD